MKTISVVTPCYNEEENIRDCYDTVRKIFEQELPSYKREHIFCDNASTDKSLAILREIAAADPCVKVIVNSRNFGPTPSTYNGVLAATGDAVLMFLPADMQDPPSLLPRFVKLWEAGNDIVYGIRAEREEGLVLRSVRRIYYWAVSKLSYIAVPPDVGDFQLVARPVIEAMRQIEDAFPYMRMMTFECGFTAVGVPYRWVARAKGISKNRLHHLVNEGMNGLITFSNAPMRMIFFRFLHIVSEHPLCDWQFCCDAHSGANSPAGGSDPHRRAFLFRRRANISDRGFGRVYAGDLPSGPAQAINRRARTN